MGVLQKRMILPGCRGITPLSRRHKDKNLVVRVWLPGCDPSKIDVQVSGNLLTIKGERTFPYLLQDGQIYGEVTVRTV
jgi:HSP20 family molecular chaperone IbpA